MTAYPGKGGTWVRDTTEVQ